MFRSLESIRADSHQQQHTHPTLTSTMSSSHCPPEKPTFPSYLLLSFPFSRRSWGAPKTSTFRPLPLQLDTPKDAAAAPTFTQPDYRIPGGEAENNILSPYSMSPESVPMPLLSKSLTGEMWADRLPNVAEVVAAQSSTRRMGISGPSTPPRTPTNNEFFSFGASSSTQTSPSTSSPFSRASPASSLGTSPPSATLCRLPEADDDPEAYRRVGSAAFPSSPFEQTYPQLSASPCVASPPLDLSGLSFQHNQRQLQRLHLQHQPPTLRCANCSTDIAFWSQIISKGFTGRHGRAYLLCPMPPKPQGVPDAANCATTNSPQVPQTARFSLLDPFGSFSSSQSSTDSSSSDNPYTSDRYNLLNVVTHAPSRRQLVTGLHVVADISCKICDKVIGWKYVDASESSQRYKIGKFILETKRVVNHQSWEDEEEEVERRVDGGAELRKERVWEDEVDGGRGEYEFLPAGEGIVRPVLVRREGTRETVRITTRRPSVSVSEDERLSASTLRKGKQKEKEEKTTLQYVLGGRSAERQKGYDNNGDVEFDSSDEDECEEIFAGTWDREVVRVRRQRRAELGRKKKAA